MSIHTSLVFIGPGYSKDLKAQPANNDPRSDVTLPEIFNLEILSLSLAKATQV